MRYARITPRITLCLLRLSVLIALSAVALSVPGSEAGAWSLRGLEGAEAPPIATPVKTFRDCQEIARCTGCKPVYRCRSCKYQRVCRRGLCEWRDVCVWGADVPVLPPNARIIRGPFRR